jgi:hypothetical protein
MKKLALHWKIIIGMLLIFSCAIWMLSSGEPDNDGCSIGDCENGYGEDINYLFGNRNSAFYSKYKGYYKNGKFHGEGVYESYKDNVLTESYDGTWKDGLRHGEGAKYKKGDFLTESYDGTWKDGLRHGQGTEKILIQTKKMPKDIKYVNISQSYGDVSYEYEGEFKDNKHHGQGTMTYASGDKYVGEWKDGKREGYGTYTKIYDEVYNRVYQGLWENGEFIGEFIGED